jgi:hypothetical protein
LKDTAIKTVNWEKLEKLAEDIHLENCGKERVKEL